MLSIIIETKRKRPPFFQILLGGLCRNPGGIHGRAAESEILFTRSTAEAKFRLCCVGPCGGAGVDVAFVPTECLLVLSLFLAFTATLHFICIFTNASSCSPLPPHVGLSQSGDSVLTECLFR